MLNLGIHLDPPYILASLVEKGRSKGASKEISIQSLQIALLSHPEDVKRLYMEDFKGKIHTALSSAELLLRPLEMEMNDPKYWEETVSFQAEATSHLAKEEFLTVPVLTSGDTKKTKRVETTLFTVPRKSLAAHLNTCRALGFEPDSVSTVSSALCHFANWKFPHLQDAFLVHLGSSEWTCVWMEKGKLKKSHCILGGVEALLLSLWEDRKRIHLQKEIGGVARQIDLLQFKPHLNLHLAETLLTLRQQLHKILASFQREGEGKPILFTGKVDAFANFAEFLTQSLEGAVLWKTDSSQPELLKFAVSLGLVLEQLESAPLQLLKEEFFPQKNWRRLGLYGLSILGSSLFLSASLFAAGWHMIAAKKNQMISSLEHSLVSWGPLSRLPTEKEKLDQWAKAIQEHNTEYPYILQAPKSAELLSWISAHPLFQETFVREVKYKLVQYPHSGALKEPYAAQVEITFEVESTTQARRIHEALLNEEEWVDTSQTIEWETSPDSYRTSFFLKNRGPHVP